MPRNLRTLLSVLALFALPAAGADECTTAVVGPRAGEDGRPLLWKNRDTDVLSNRVVFVKETPYSYLGLADLEARSGRSVFAGINAEGFAIMNSVAYNLPKKAGEPEDREGILMADALRTCRTAADFEAYLKANLGRDLGARANFGVIDAEGAAVIFEVHNQGYERVEAGAVPEGYLVNTNWSRTGQEAKGAGYVRFDRATELLKAGPKPVSARDVLRRLARDTGNALVSQPTLADFATLPGDRDRWVFTRDSINKSYTAAAVVIVGRRPNDPRSRATMWVLPGEPVTAVALPLWVEAGKSPEPLWKGDEAPLWVESMRIKKIARPYPESDREEYLNARRLDNRDGTGFLPRLLAAEDDIFRRAATFLKVPRTPEELAAFQDEMTAKALETMRSVAAGPLRITVLYDNTAARPDCGADWGFACLVEGTQKTILFDTGTKADVFAGNVGALRVDLSRVDALVISHPHGDHTGGLSVAMKARPGLPVLLPFGSPSVLAESLRSAGASVATPEGPADVGPDALVTGPVGGRIPEQALVIKRPGGLVVVTGCSHPGIVAIVEKARQVAGGKLLAVLGGFHLLEHEDDAVAGIVARFQELGVEKVGATHCTGEKAIAAFRKAYGPRFVEMGAGRVVELP